MLHNILVMGIDDMSTERGIRFVHEEETISGRGSEYTKLIEDNYSSIIAFFNNDTNAKMDKE